MVKKKKLLYYTSIRKTSFHAKFQAQCLHGLPVLHRYSLNILSGLIIISFQEI